MVKAVVRFGIRGDQADGLVGAEQLVVWGLFLDQRVRGHKWWRLVRHLAHKDGQVVDGLGDRRGILFKDVRSERGPFALTTWEQKRVAKDGMALIQGESSVVSPEYVSVPEPYLCRVGAFWKPGDVSAKKLARYLKALSRGFKPRLSFISPDTGLEGERLKPHQVFGLPSALMGGRVVALSESAVTIEAPEGQIEYLLAPGLRPSVGRHELVAAGQRLWEVGTLSEKTQDAFLQVSERGSYLPSFVLRELPQDEKEFTRLRLRVDHLPEWQVVEMLHSGHLSHLGDRYGGTRVDLLASEWAVKTARFWQERRNREVRRSGEVMGVSS